MILDGNGSRGVQNTCRALGSGFDQPHLGVCDRDVMSDEEVDDLRRRVPGLFVLAFALPGERASASSPAVLARSI